MTKLIVFLTDRFADWECALLMAASRAYYGFDVQTASPTGGTITSAGGLQVHTDYSLDQLPGTHFDAIAICGGSAWSDVDDAPDMSPLLDSLDRSKTIVGAICDANFALAEAGWLNNVKHTANAPDALTHIQNYAGGAHYLDQPQAVSDGNIITAAGTSPVSFMREMLLALGRDANELAFYTGLYAAEHAPTPKKAA